MLTDNPEPKMPQKLEWRNVWCHPTWSPMQAQTLEQAGEELAGRMPYTEDGTQIRTEDGKIFDWKPPTQPQINWGP